MDPKIQEVEEFIDMLDAMVSETELPLWILEMYN